jgi:hypothetical protein
MGGYVMFLRMYMHSQAQEQKERWGGLACVLSKWRICRKMKEALACSFT